jgi:hypothetical protein
MRLEMTAGRKDVGGLLLTTVLASCSSDARRSASGRFNWDARYGARRS